MMSSQTTMRGDSHDDSELSHSSLKFKDDSLRGGEAGGAAHDEDEDDDDEALKVLRNVDAEQKTIPITPEEEKALMRKVDWRLLPLVSLATGLQYCDKAALSVATLFGLITDLKLYVVSNGEFDTLRYTIVATVFFVGYIIGTPVLSTIAQRFPTAKICSLYMLLWGLVTVLMPTCSSFEGLIAQRFFLGFLEGGVSPAFLSILGMWYSKKEQGLRAPVIYSANGFFVVPLLAITYGIVHIGNRAHAWKTIYYLIGGLTIAHSLVLLAFLPDSPVTANFLTTRQRYIAVERLRANQAGLTSKRIKLSHFVEAIKDVKVVVLILTTFCVSGPVGLMGSFTPLVINKVYGANAMRTLLLLMPSGAIAAMMNVIGGYAALYFKNARVAVVIFCSVASLIGTALLWQLPLTAKHGLLTGIYLVAICSGAFGTLTGLALSNTAGATKKTAVSSMVFITIALANIATPFLFKRSEQPRYPSGFKATLVLQCIGVVLCFVYAGLCMRENRKRDQETVGQDKDLAFKDLTDKENPAFRYVY